MKKIIQSIGLMSLICFSFMYTDKVMEVVSEKDTLMIEIENEKDNYYIDVIEATIEEDTIIPGINGRKVDVKESYNNMRELGTFREDKLIYYITYPKILLSNNYDKFIINGNKTKREVSIIFKIINDNYLDDFFKIISKHNIKVNLFVDSSYLNKNIKYLTELETIELYGYGNNGIYTHDNIITTVNIISNKTNNKKNFCLSEDKNKETIKICSKDKYNTIYPSIIGNDSAYNKIKTNVGNGSIISLEINKKTLTELPNIIEFIKGKGLEINYLSDLLSQEIS